jgi:hypothetical protein
MSTNYAPQALGRVYSTSHNLSAICVRFGSPEFDQDLDGSRECRQYGEPIENLDAPNVGISSRDTVRASVCVSLYAWIIVWLRHAPSCNQQPRAVSRRCCLLNDALNPQINKTKLDSKN